MSKLEELKKRIENNKKKQEDVSSPFSVYLTHFNIVQGFDKYPASMLLFLYKKVFLAKYTDFLDVSDKTLYKLLGSKFERKRGNRSRYYLIDKSLLKNLPVNLDYEYKLWKDNGKLY